MFNNVRNKIRYFTIGIGSIILLLIFLTTLIVARSNIQKETNQALDEAINFVVSNPSKESYKETEVMIFKIEENVVVQYNDNYKQYDEKIISNLYKECNELENSPIKVGFYYFYYNIINLDGDLIYFVYDASLAINNLNLLMITIAIFFALLICIIASAAVYFSNKIIDPLETTYTTQKEFIENASHELKTPLTIINANVDSLTNIDENNQKWVDNIKNQTGRMNNLVVEILELFRIENQGNDNNEVVNFSNYLKKTILSFEVLTYEKNIRLEQDIEDNILIKSKESNIDKMINILLDNALKYVSDNGYINIVLKKEKKKTVLIVENSGGNLEKEDLEKIFNRFYKKNDEDKKSFGLGLAILKAIVDSLEGEIKVECNKQEYTRFIIKI